jgi:hypothetical protein
LVTGTAFDAGAKQQNIFFDDMTAAGNDIFLAIFYPSAGRLPGQLILTVAADSCGDFFIAGFAVAARLLVVLNVIYRKYDLRIL